MPKNRRQRPGKFQPMLLPRANQNRREILTKRRKDQNPRSHNQNLQKLKLSGLIGIKFNP